MRIKRKNGLKIAAITIALVLCLALAVGITGAWYQAKRQATGTLSMDQGIIIDYKGFGKTPDEGIWTRENKTTFLLFDETNAQPGQNISVNTAGIRANEKSVNFYARVKLSYKFYNNGTEVTTLPNASDLITTSGNFFGANWVDGGGADGYYYYATGSTLNKFEKGAAATTPFVNLFATDAKFIIEGEGFTGADSNGESGGFKIDDTTSINKIEVYLTLETLQGDATAEQAKALGWKIAQTVDFAKVKDNAKVENSSTKAAFATTTEEEQEQAEQAQADFEALQVAVGDSTDYVALNTVKFPYDETVTLKFDSKNVDYITLKYSTGAEETFGEKAEDFANDYLSETALKVNAKSSKGTVTGYTIGLWDSKYTGFVYSKYDIDCYDQFEVVGGVVLSQNFDTSTALVIESKIKARERDFKLVVKGYNSISEFAALLPGVRTFRFPLKVDGYDKTINNGEEFEEFMGSVFSGSVDFMESKYKDKMVFYYSAIIPSNIGGTELAVKGIGSDAFANSNVTSVTINDGIEYVGDGAFADCQNLSSVSLPNSLKKMKQTAFESTSINEITIPENVEEIGESVFAECTNLTTIIVQSNVLKNIGFYAFPTTGKVKATTTKDGIEYLGSEENPYVVAYGVSDTTKTSYTIDSNCKVICYDFATNIPSATLIVLPEGLLGISIYSIRSTLLTEIELPTTLQFIAGQAFRY